MATTVMAIKKVFYPFDEAVKKAIEQNVEIDYEKGLASDPYHANLDHEARVRYQREAEELLATTGENRMPEYPLTEHICVQKEDDVSENQTR